MRSNILSLSLLLAGPSFSFVIPEQVTVQRIFPDAWNEPVVQPIVDAISPVADNVAEHLNSLLGAAGVRRPTFETDDSEKEETPEEFTLIDVSQWESFLGTAESQSVLRHDHKHHGNDHKHDGDGHKHHDHDGDHGKRPDHGHRHRNHDHDPPLHDPHGPHPDTSLLEIIKSSEHSSGFYEHIKDDTEFTGLLDGRDKNVTVFVPSNDAFERLDKFRKHHDIPDDVVRRILMYHFANGTFDYEDLKFHNTLLTLLPEDQLGDGEYQRLRIGPDNRVNMYAKLKMVDIYCANGVAHGIDHILLPPPEIETILHLIPTVFSTSEAALLRTGVHEDVKKLRGGTVFLPTNNSWKKLGFAINAFLFSDYGTPYLKALMKYHVVPDRILYSDALVGKGDVKSTDERDDPDGLTHGYSHSYLPTLLEDKHISADINRFARFLSFRVNGMNSVLLPDGLARNGVIQVPDHILIPPHTLGEHHDPPKVTKNGDEDDNDNEWLSVNELIQLLDPLVERSNDSEL